MAMRSFRATEAELQRWEAFAAARGQKFSALVREGLSTVCDGPVQRRRPNACTARVPAGAYCRACDRVHS